MHYCGIYCLGVVISSIWNKNLFVFDIFRKNCEDIQSVLLVLLNKGEIELLDFYNENINKNVKIASNTTMQPSNRGKAGWVMTLTENPIIGIVDVLYGEIMENLQKFVENEAKYMILFKRDYYGDYEKIEDEILKYNLKVLTRNEEGMILEKN